MPTDMRRTRILFVDDEPAIRATLPVILEQQGFNVTTVATVSEALREIASQPFDALISDLNIGEAGDGFTVVSAMRRTQPHCVNFILTGFPAFETALQAIRSQVDDYLVKPANIRELVDSLKHKLTAPRETCIVQTLSLAEFLHSHASEIVDRCLLALKAHPTIGSMPLTDAERTDHLPDVLAEIVRQLQSEYPDNQTEKLLFAGAKHGEVRRRQGYSLELLVDDTRALDSSTYAIVQDHLLEISLSNLIPDLGRFNDALEAHLKASIRGFNLDKAA